jgi:hypothetical protein
VIRSNGLTPRHGMRSGWWRRGVFGSPLFAKWQDENFTFPADRFIAFSRVRAMAWAGIVFCLFSTVALAQQTGPIHPGQDAPEVYLSFFFFHEDFARWTEARVSADPSRKAQIINSSAKYLGIAPGDFATLETITGQITRQLRALSDEAHSYVQAAAKPRRVSITKCLRLTAAAEARSCSQGST